MGGLFQSYFSNKWLFYNLFNEAAKNMMDMAALLVTAVNTEEADKRGPIFKEIGKLENNGDDITHKIYLSLNKVMFTPLPRNSIHALASSIDDVADTLHEASGRMFLYDVVCFSPAIKQISAIILQAVTEVEKTVGQLKTPKCAGLIITSCRQIKNFEHQADQVYYAAVAELFALEKDAINLIKYREILGSLESTVNRCKNTAEVLESISFNNY